MAAILKIFKTKSTTLSDDLLCVKFQKSPLYEVNLTFLQLVYHGNGRHFDFFNPQKLPHTTVDIPTKFHEVWWEE